MLRENTHSLSESVFQRKQNCLCSVIYLQFLEAAVGMLLLMKVQGQKLWGTVRFMLCFSPLFRDAVLSLPSYERILMKSHSY